MRSLLTVAALVAAVAGTSFGVIHVKLTVDQAVLNANETATVTIWGMGTSAGLFSLAGDIVASGPTSEAVKAPGPGGRSLQRVG